MLCKEHVYAHTSQVVQTLLHRMHVYAHSSQVLQAPLGRVHAYAHISQVVQPRVLVQLADSGCHRWGGR